MKRFFSILFLLTAMYMAQANNQVYALRDAQKTGVRLVTTFKAPTSKSYRPIAWNNTGKSLYTSWGTAGSKLARIDLDTRIVKVFLSSGTQTLSGIAYKSDGPKGILTVTTAVPPVEVRLWDSRIRK